MVHGAPTLQPVLPRAFTWVAVFCLALNQASRQYCSSATAEDHQVPNDVLGGPGTQHLHPEGVTLYKRGHFHLFVMACTKGTVSMSPMRPFALEQLHPSWDNVCPTHVGVYRGGNIWGWCPSRKISLPNSLTPKLKLISDFVVALKKYNSEHHTAEVSLWCRRRLM